MRFARGDARDHIVSHKNDHSVAPNHGGPPCSTGSLFVREKMFSTHFLFAHLSATYHSAAAGRSPGAEGEFALT
jgi:hypothetical protein